MCLGIWINVDRLVLFHGDIVFRIGESFRSELRVLIVMYLNNWLMVISTIYKLKARRQNLRFSLPLIS